MLELWPARVLAIAGNTLGTLAVVVVALASLRRRPLGNALILAGVGVAAVGSALGGLGVGALAPLLAAAALLLYAGFVVPTAGSSRRPEAPSPAGGLSSPPPRSRSQTARSTPTTARRTSASTIAPGQASVGDQLREHPQATHRIQHHQRQHRVLGA